jgi:tetratricopeptide (TPR) repeat protein
MIKLLIIFQILRPSSLLELPTASLPGDPVYWQIGTSTSFSLASKYDPHATDFDLNGMVAFNGKWFVGVNIFTLSEISFDVGTIILNESQGSPLSLSFGLRNVSWKKYISSVGGEPEEGGGFSDDNSYILRSPELLSFYGVITRHINSSLILHIGLGRGEFIGYGPRSKYLNTDKFLKTPHEYFTFGLFGALEFHLTPSLHLAFEADGRDLNAGIFIDVEKFKFVLEVQKIEHFLFSGYPNFQPRFNLGLSMTSRLMVPSAQPVPVMFTILNSETKEPVKGVVIKFLQTEIPGIISDAKGVATLNILPGKYLVSITHPEFKGLKAKINVKRNKPLKVKIAVKPKVSKRDIALKKIREGDALFRAGKLIEARKSFQEALKIYPRSKTAQDRLASVEKAIKNKLLELKSRAKYYERKGEYKSAIGYWKEVLKISPQDAEAMDKIAELDKKLKAPPPSKKKVVKKPKAPQKPSKAQIEKTLNKAIQAFNAGNYKEAKKLLQQVLKWEPGNSRAKDYLRRTEARLKLLGE